MRIIKQSVLKLGFFSICASLIPQFLSWVLIWWIYNHHPVFLKHHKLLIKNSPIFKPHRYLDYFGAYNEPIGPLLSLLQILDLNLVKLIDTFLHKEIALRRLIGFCIISSIIPMRLQLFLHINFYLRVHWLLQSFWLRHLHKSNNLWFTRVFLKIHNAMLSTFVNLLSLQFYLLFRLGILDRVENLIFLVFIIIWSDWMNTWRLLAMRINEFVFLIVILNPHFLLLWQR